MGKLVKICSCFILFSFIAFNVNISLAEGELEKSKTVVYFFSTTCGSCLEVSNYIGEIAKNKHTIIKYNISIEESKKIFNAYCSNYNVDNDYRYVPIVFVGDKYLVGKQMILDHLEYELLNQDEVKTMLLSSEDGSFEEDIKIINSTKWISVFVAGLVNGLNPCSLAMFIFLISICFVNKEKVKKVALVFLAGKFLTFLLLGTIFYKLLSYVDFSFISTITKAIGILIILVLVVFNLLDFIEVKNNRYNNVKLQLPLGVRKFNHNIMKKINGVMEKNICYLPYLL